MSDLLRFCDSKVKTREIQKTKISSIVQLLRVLKQRLTETSTKIKTYNSHWYRDD